MLHQAQPYNQKESFKSLLHLFCVLFLSPPVTWQRQRFAAAPAGNDSVNPTAESRGKKRLWRSGWSFDAPLPFGMCDGNSLCWWFAGGGRCPRSVILLKPPPARHTGLLSKQSEGGIIAAEQNDASEETTSGLAASRPPPLQPLSFLWTYLFVDFFWPTLRWWISGRYSLAHLRPNLRGFTGPGGQFWCVICRVARPLAASASDSLNQQHIRPPLPHNPPSCTKPPIPSLTAKALGPRRSFSVTRSRMSRPPPRLIATQPNASCPSLNIHLNIKSIMRRSCYIYAGFRLCSPPLLLKLGCN